VEKVKVFFLKQLAILLIFISFSSSMVLAADENSITYIEFISKINSLIDEKFNQSEVIMSEFQSLAKTHKLENSQENFKEYLRVKLIFEATRDSGLWKIKWKITDREPNSIEIWNQWSNKSFNGLDLNKPLVTAEAECDELSALFAMMARSLGVKKVGLFWPTSNHTVAVWTAKGINNTQVRVVVPTSQVFLSKDASLGTLEFNPYQQKTIYNYDNLDVPGDFKLSTEMTQKMLSQLEVFGRLSQNELQKKRNSASRILGGSRNNIKTL